MKRKRVVVLGATGSIGDSTLKVAHDIPERMEIVGLAANSNAEKLVAAANKMRPEAICLVDETKMDILQRDLDYQPRIFSGEVGLRELACLTNADMVLVAIVGTGGLDRKSTRLNSSHQIISYAVFCLKKKKDS